MLDKKQETKHHFNINSHMCLSVHRVIDISVLTRDYTMWQLAWQLIGLLIAYLQFEKALRFLWLPTAAS